MTDLAAAAAQETIDLHVLLQAWFRAEGDPDLAKILARFDADFTMITTGGALLTFAQVSAMFAKSRGARPGLVMDIQDPITLHTDSVSALVTYRELQHLDGKTTERRSTGLVLRHPDSPTLIWRHLQETWIA